MRLFVMSLVIAGGLLAMPGCGGGDSGPVKPSTNVPPPAAPPKTDAPGGACGA
ncbi:MAG: hypothetical protein ACKOUR_01480 [Planctomycetota bacterium]